MRQIQCWVCYVCMCGCILVTIDLYEKKKKDFVFDKGEQLLIEFACVFV